MKQYDLHAAAVQALPETEQLLCDLLRYPSLPGQEHEAMQFLDQAFRRPALTVERVAMTDELRRDPDYSDALPDISYAGRFNLRIRRPGSGSGRRVLFNAHTDVVPPNADMPEPWTPRVEQGVVFGRGACDAKGQVATLFLMQRMLDLLGIDLKGEVITHLVCEEEVGGNGTLALTRRGERADGCVVLEPSDGKLYTSIRGAVWFRIAFTGKAGHSGQAEVSRSALLMARDAMRILEDYHADLLKKSRGFPLFDEYPNPMPLTFGHLAAGRWPSMAPASAVLEGVLGLLPNKTKEEVCDEMRAALRRDRDDDFVRNTTIHFTYRHDASVLDPEHELPKCLRRAAGRCGAPLEIGGMTASCDAWLYRNQLGIPALVYGPGSMKVAHARDERIALADIASAAEVLVAFLLDYCGVAG
jgi:acetylornithine deacetylase